MSSSLHPDLQGRPGPLPPPARALTIGAHPDDAEFGAGATLARWADERCDITMIVITDGSKGTWDPTQRPCDVAARRRIEQQQAAAVLGAGGVVHLDHTDGELEYTMALREELARLVRVHLPDVVLTHDPWQRYQLHPDHRAAGKAGVDAVVAAREPLFYPKQKLEAHRPQAILLWSADEPDHAEPAEAGMARKVEALLCHSSQSETTMGDAARSDGHRRAFSDRIAQRAIADGTRLGTEPAEVFKRLTP